MWEFLQLAYSSYLEELNSNTLKLIIFVGDHMDLNEIQQRELDSLRDANNELQKKVKELEAKIVELEKNQSQ